MSKFKPGDIVYYMDGSTLCQAVVCVEDGQWPLVEDGWCLVYNISPEYGTRVWKHHDESQHYCDMVRLEDLHSTPEDLISTIKSDITADYMAKIQVLDSYNKGSRDARQSLAGKIKAILLGRSVKDD